MKDIPVTDVRNVAFMGHTGCGKTTLIDSILADMGVVERAGSPEDGTSNADWTEEEKRHEISIWAKPFDGTFQGKSGRTRRLVVVDTPGFADFTGQLHSAAAVTDAALIVIDAASGIQVGTTRAWRLCEKQNKPRAIVVTGLDKENTDFEQTLASIQEVWGERCEPVVLPVNGMEDTIDVLDADPSSLPDEVSGRVSDLKGRLVESAAETRDELIEKYLADEPLSAEEIGEGLRWAVAHGGVIPVLAACPKTGKGVHALLETIGRLFPSPEDIVVHDAEGHEIPTGEDAPFAGLVWRCVNDPYVGHLNFLRVYSGTFKLNAEALNVAKDQKERLGSMLYINGRKQDAVQEAKAGDIVALAKLKNTELNDTLCDPAHKVTFKPIEFPHPVAAYALFPKNRGEEDKLGIALQRAAEEDPSIFIERTRETHETVMWGMGDMHLEVTLERIRDRSNVELDHHTPKVAYKETITGNGEGHYRHKKQSGGRGQFGECYVRVAPRDPSDEEWFHNAIVGGAIPSNFVPACEKGFVEGLQQGPMVGAEVINVKVELYDGSYHDVDSSEVAFKIAGSRALHEALEKAKPVLLEPIMHVRVMVPEQYMGDITGVLNSKRGRILGMGAEEGMQIITADVPQAEMFKFCSELRSLTAGQGTFDMHFDRYERVPGNVAQQVIEQARQEKDQSA
ncbi:elongation factor G [Kiritimatiella glycovorans]|uniref:Elongation factor G n=1 Tax=Kiritimatiella glycovorans TaxID=1307763 RepID=A0A0G3EJP0_9BACT|nr:elongation factor G [Kiritimatiella glycovorans]AKJ65010.1 Translation elongation factor G [Kiritimatiella glycovorans]